MPRLDVPSFPRAWPRAALLALIAITAAGCADSARFRSGPYASNEPPRPPETTGSIGTRPVYSRPIVSQPLPAPRRPATVASGGIADGGQGLGAYRPNGPEYTGSVTARREPTPLPPPPVPAPPPVVGHWTWDGGSPVTVRYGESVETIARRYGVPTEAILQTNHIASPESVRPGQRLVIPRYVRGASASVPTRAAPRPEPVRTAERAPAERVPAESVHIVEPGESLMGIAHREGVSLVALARANNIQPYAKIEVGEQLRVPGGHHVAARREEAPKVTTPRTVPVEHVSSIPTQTARIAKPEVNEPKPVTKTAEATGALPSFRWPVRGRIIASFGPRPNGTQNDGINLAVPEGTPIKAADDGVVAYAGNELKGYGNLVLIRHSDGYVSAYANASQILVKRGETVKRGQVIARAGQTGDVASPQLHFEIRKGSTPVDPMRFLGGA
jgi:murein DD-endopeptidase MepM/ murein hydrolase activator NlpD